MKSSSYVTYDTNNVRYTLYFNLGNYIPQGGFLEVLLPKELSFISNIASGFATDGRMFDWISSSTSKSFKVKAN